MMHNLKHSAIFAKFTTYISCGLYRKQKNQLPSILMKFSGYIVLDIVNSCNQIEIRISLYFPSYWGKFVPNRANLFPLSSHAGKGERKFEIPFDYMNLPWHELCILKKSAKSENIDFSIFWKVPHLCSTLDENGK